MYRHGWARSALKTSCPRTSVASTHIAAVPTRTAVLTWEPETPALDLDQ